jgi:hypothetical protein
MNRVLFPNFFFEDELQSSAKVASTSSRQLATELGPTIGLLKQESLSGDFTRHNQMSQRSIVLIAEDARPDDVPSALQGIEFLTMNELTASNTQQSQASPGNLISWEVVPWGWSDAAVNTLWKTGLCFDTPQIDAVRQINSRQFQSQFDVVVEINGVERRDSFGTLCGSLSEVTTAISNAGEYSQRGWVIKADLSHACRNRLLGTSREYSNEQRAWLESRFAAGESVYVEPWVERVSECGLQFTVTKTVSVPPEVQFVGAAEMLTDEAGRYRGSIVKATGAGSENNSVWQPAIEHGRQIAEAAATNGYFGAIGIDCMVFRCPHDNRYWLRLSHDINGRLTMGRVALSLRRLLEPEETGFWIHANADFLRQNGNRIDELSSGGVRMIPTSPGRVGGGSVKIATALFVSSDPERLNTIRMQIHGQSAKMPLSPEQPTLADPVVSGEGSEQRR